VQLPPWLQEMAVRTQPRTYVGFVTFVLIVFFVVPPEAQVAVSDADLAAVSGGRTVKLGRIGGGAPVTEVPLEVYVARVLAGEAEPRAADAAYQALAIAIRTYVLANVDRHPREDFDLCDSTHCQVPRAANEATRRAAMATAGQVLSYQNRPAELFYSASCGGRSESAGEIGLSADLPYLQVAEDDVHAGEQPWVTTLTLRQVQDALRRINYSGQLRDVRVDARNESGRASRLRLTGMQPDTVAGYQFRMAVGAIELRSTAFAVERRGESLRFTGRGFGHGVGMCVIGAGRRAVRGESAADILSHYYPGLALVRLDTPALNTAAGDSPVGRALPAPPLSAEGSGSSGEPDRVRPTAVTSPVVARVPAGSGVRVVDLERVAAEAYDRISKTLGTSLSPITIELHETLDSFRAATGMPWWVSTVSAGTDIDLVPAALLAQREGLETAVRTAMASLLVAAPLADRPAWVRVGAARYFGKVTPPAPPAANARLRCPEDNELTLAISAPAQRDAEARAEACFARELARVKDWRAVR
jgi:stage II sporulation protein D